jgi:hypothetical protein
MFYEPKFNYLVHKSPPVVPILSQIDRIHTTSYYLLKLCLNIKLLPKFASSECFFFSLRPTRLPNLILLDLIIIRCKEYPFYETPRYVVLFNSLPYYCSSFQIFFSASWFQTLSVHFPPLMVDTKFHTRSSPQTKL